MLMADVIGKVTLSRCHESLVGARWLVAVPLSKEGLKGKKSLRGEPFVVFDELGANADTLIAVSEGAEAAAAFHPDTKPIDAYNAAILDRVTIED
ncbi:MAG: carbon dioxide concentrating mechanism protein CcmL [Planctomycetota bacterium]|nr:carbon dioxide concentrating mechanism protein CcmL [Planctomycetota bacterium]